MTTQPKDLMTLDEILAEINDRLKTAQRCLEANLLSQAEGKETLELAVRLNGEDVRFHTSALHHLEAGRKDVRFSKDEAAGMAIRVEDVMNIMSAMLQGAESQTHPQDYKRQTLIIMARERNRHLDYVAKRLKGEVVAPTAQEVKG